MEAIIVISALFALGTVFNLISRSIRQDQRRRQWDALRSQAGSEDPGVRRKAAKKAWKLLEGSE